MEIAIVVYDGFDDLDALGPHEVFSHAARQGTALSVDLYTLDGATTVETSHGLTIGTAGELPESPDILVVPGGGWSTEKAASARGEANRGKLPQAIADRYERGTTVAAVCTGAMLLAACGLTDDRPATTHHTALEDLDTSGATVVESRVVDDGDVVTAGGITSGIDLALHLLDREFGTTVQETVAQTMEYEPRGGVFETEN
jgi:transcriptional regulator GlxA family with amidase domain